MDGTAHIKVKRRANYMGFLRAFKIYVDGKKMAAVGNGKEVAFEIEPGRHSIDVLGSLWAKSRVLDCDIQPGETLSLECGVEGKYMYPFLAIVFLSAISKTLLRMLPGGKAVAVGIAGVVAIYSLVITIMTFRRGTIYYLKRAGLGQD